MTLEHDMQHVNYISDENMLQSDEYDGNNHINDNSDGRNTQNTSVTALKVSETIGSTL
jgi:hypothetical protein